MTTPHSPTASRGRLFRLAVATVAALALMPAFARTSYDVDYRIGFLPAEGLAQVRIAVTPGDGQLRELKLDMPEERYSELAGDGDIVRKGDIVTWTPPRTIAQSSVMRAS